MIRKFFRKTTNNPNKDLLNRTNKIITNFNKKITIHNSNRNR